MENLGSLTLTAKKRLQMDGVNNVDTFTENILKLTVNGEKVEIKGNGIKISAYNKNTGLLIADGNFCEIKYGAVKTPFIKKIFK